MSKVKIVLRQVVHLLLYCYWLDSGLISVYLLRAGNDTKKIAETLGDDDLGLTDLRTWGGNSGDRGRGI